MCSRCTLAHLLSGSQTALHPASLCFTSLLKIWFSCFHPSSSENMDFDGLAFRIRYVISGLASSSPMAPREIRHTSQPLLSPHPLPNCMEAAVYPDMCPCAISAHHHLPQPLQPAQHRVLMLLIVKVPAPMSGMTTPLSGSQLSAGNCTLVSSHTLYRQPRGLGPTSPTHCPWDKKDKGDQVEEGAPHVSLSCGPHN